MIDIDTIESGAIVGGSFCDGIYLHIGDFAFCIGHTVQ